MISVLGCCVATRHLAPQSADSGLRSRRFAAMQDGLSLGQYLGAKPTERVQLYANINRSLFATDRTPADFGRVAERAAKAGFKVFKCAPFDEVRPPSSPDRILEEAVPGWQESAQSREAVGADATVLVDCHSRFERDTAPLIVDELAKLNVGWFEEPVQPTSDPEDLAAIARWAPMPVAGGESGYGVEFFDDLLDTEAVAIVMPDIKHCGGAAEAVTIGRSTGSKGKGSRCIAHLGLSRCWRAATRRPPYQTRCPLSTPCTRLSGEANCSLRVSAWKTVICTSHIHRGWARSFPGTSLSDSEGCGTSPMSR